mgnify:CR=1 FL=1
MKKLLCLAVPFVLFAAQKQSLSVDECNKIFEQRKAEIAFQIEKLEEKEQSLAAFQNANKNVQKKIMINGIFHLEKNMIIYFIVINLVYIVRIKR